MCGVVMDDDEAENVRIVELLIFVIILVLICHLHHDISLLYTMHGAHCIQYAYSFFF